MNNITVVGKQEEAPYRQFIESYGSPLLVLDCEALRQHYQKLKRALPGVELFFAIKSMPVEQALITLASEGASFDIATSGEIDMLRKIGVQSSRTVHTHPIKRDIDIRDALTFGCKTFVVDNIDELQKFVPWSKNVEILLRVSFRGKDAACDLSRKFGCGVQKVLFLLEEASRLGIKVKGLSFHVGSQSMTPDGHIEAINACREFFMDSTLCGTEHLTMLDIGGGFPADYQRSGFDLEAFCAPIVHALAEYPAHVRIIAEPGRVLSAPCMTSICTVVGKAERAEEQWYYLDDGVYGGYSGIVYDHGCYPLTLFSDGECSYPSVLAGPTCDSIDIVQETTNLPLLQIGDILVGEQMGAYSIATASEFNSIPKPKLVVINSSKPLAYAQEERTRFKPVVAAVN
ncbi:MAG: ornithine decarboxylase [Lysobacterales bacterium]